MKNMSVVAALVAGLLVGPTAGCATAAPKHAPAAPAAAKAHPTPAPAANTGTEKVYRVPIGDGHVRGPADAPVTLIEFADYQCPFCARAFRTLQRIRKTYGDQVRFVFKNNPLLFHQYAAGAAEAAEAAGAQGKFWAYHDLLFRKSPNLTPSELEQSAQQLGLDMARFRQDVSSNAYQHKIAAQQSQAVSLGATGTPAFFINGVYVRGAQPFSNFKRVIDAQLAKAKALEAKGVAPKDVYATLIAHGATHVALPRPHRRASRPAPTQFARIDLTPKDHVRGPAGAKVTMVEFGDYQCPFCKRAESTVDLIRKTYGEQVRFVFRNFPLPFHKYADGAAEAAEAAAAQGKFWQFHDKLYEVSPKLDRASLEGYAQGLGLDLARFQKALDANAYKSFIYGQEQDGQQHGVGGTPTFFVNGRKISGAQPFSAFKTVLDEEIQHADALLNKGTPAKQLYAKLMAENEAMYGKSAPVRRGPAPDDQGLRDRHRQLAGQGSQERAGDPRRVVRLPVPVLQARRGHGGAAPRGSTRARSASSTSSTPCPSTPTPRRPPRPPSPPRPRASSGRTMTSCSRSRRS